MRAEQLKMSIFTLETLLWVDSESLWNPALRMYLTVSPSKRTDETNILSYTINFIM